MNAAFKRLIKFKQYTMPEMFKETVTLLPNHGPLRSAFHQLDTAIEEYIDKMPPIPKSPSPRRATPRVQEGEHIALEMSHPLEGKLGGRRRTYRRRKQSRRRR